MKTAPPRRRKMQATNEMKRQISLAAASALYLGFAPKIPGTCASLATTLVFALICHYRHHIAPELHISAVCLITLGGILSAGEVSREKLLDDPPYVVIDEVAGQLLTFLLLPGSIINLVLGFVVFRAFDICKPFPIARLESLKGGVGIMADDLLAGIYGNIVLHIINRML